MTRRFQVKTPDQLLALQEYAKDGNISRAASIWRTTREKKGDKGTSWDDKIFVDFCAYDGTRTAIVHKVTIIICPPTAGKSEIDPKHNDPPRLFAHLRYNPALQWCKEHLQEVQ